MSDTHKESAVPEPASTRLENLIPAEPGAGQDINRQVTPDESSDGRDRLRETFSREEKGQADGDGASGSSYWRSLEELAATTAFREALEKEFSDYDPDTLTSMSRRSFVSLMAASMALAGLGSTGCRRWPQEQVLPFTNRTDGRDPGQSLEFSTMVERAGVATGLLAESFDGRPIKLEGHPDHPFSLGSTDALTQGSVLELYDPDRSRVVVQGKRDPKRRTWDDFRSFIQEHLKTGSSSKSIAVLSESTSSLSIASLRKRFLEVYPDAKWYEWEPINRDNEIAGSRLALDRAVRPQYHLDRAKIIACFDSDLLGGHPAWLRHARQWAKSRQSADQGHMNRLYAIESSYTLTGGVADERLPIAWSKVGVLLNQLAVRLGLPAARTGLEANSIRAEHAGIDEVESKIAALAADLAEHRGQSIVVAGPNQPPEVHALVWAVNEALGNIGKTISLTEEPVAGDQTNLDDIVELTGRLHRGELDTLVILGGNPVYDAPADLDFAKALEKASASVHLSLYYNETSIECEWHLPRAHWLECWGDGRAWDGTVSVQQPLILPLFDGRSIAEVLASMLGEHSDQGYDLVRGSIRAFLASQQIGEGDFERAWRRIVHDGLVEDSAFKTVQVQSNRGTVGGIRPSGGSDAGDLFELVFVPDRSVYDGRFANNAWLQELPDPLTKLTWDNAALINIADAKRLKLKNGDVIKIGTGQHTLEIAVYLMPGQPTGVISLPLGYGRTQAGEVGSGVGFDTYRLRTSGSLHSTSGVRVTRTAKRYKLALTQNHHLMDTVGRKAVKRRIGEKGGSGLQIKEATLNQYKDDAHFAHIGAYGDHHLQLFEEPFKSKPKREGGPTAFNHPHAWGMAVDMNSCIGCNACVVACQAENNVPVVGKDQVLVNREMQWIRIDRYFKTDTKADPESQHPDVVYMPVMCQQCENAPCEQVCPVAATTHDTEGLNVMVYNRCIGTRYCSNNCPYKVRRFNYFDFHSKKPRGRAKPWLNLPDMEQSERIDLLKRMVFNPDVTVRMRGVMEKCTFCIQRIAQAKSKARVELAHGKRSTDLLRDEEVLTACQQACPTQVIVFGDLNDPNSKVSRLQENNRAYELLGDLNTRPRNRFLAKIRNPVPVNQLRDPVRSAKDQVLHL